jgi:4-diphosphocytidyl-2-C-methyl-D-erythritol kinase
MITYPNAKVNLGLYITEKRTDGFHSLETIFLPIPNLCDILEVLPQEHQQEDVVFSISGLDVDGDFESNLCVKAYKHLNKHTPLPKVAMHLHKQVPMGAGLGGGSANGAFALKMLNAIATNPIIPKALEGIALDLGSDCPFFLTNMPSFASGRGEQLHKLELNLSGVYVLLVNPNIHVSTGMAYSLSNPKPAVTDLRKIASIPFDQWKTHVHNDFEKVVFPLHPEIKELKELLYQLGAFYASMSGSGSTVFGLFHSKPDVKVIPPNYYYHLSEF